MHVATQLQIIESRTSCSPTHAGILLAARQLIVLNRFTVAQILNNYFLPFPLASPPRQCTCRMPNDISRYLPRATASYCLLQMQMQMQMQMMAFV
jgi:hypothetical protein